jgi:YidC/Oxa1 family membrane protein insertase
MDKKTIIGIVLMVALFVGYGFYQANVLEEQQQYEKAVREHKALVEAERVAKAEAEALAESMMTAEERAERDAKLEADAKLAMVAKHGDTLISAMEGESAIHTLENDFMTVAFDSRGGKITDVTLKKHTRYAEEKRTEPVKLIQPGSAKFGLDLRHEGSAETISTNDYLFSSKVDSLDNSYVVTMKLMCDEAADAYVEYVYTMYKTGKASRDHLIDFTLNKHNMENFLADDSALVLRWDSKSMKNERSFQNESNASTIAYYNGGEDEFDELDADGKRQSHRNLAWIALKQQYFSSIFMAKDDVHARFGFKSANENSDFMKLYRTRIVIPQKENKDSYKFAFYYGPNDYNIMNNVEFAGRDNNLTELIPMGGWIIGWVNKYFTVPVFNWLSNHGLGFGLIIFILTVMVKLIILPLTYKSYMSTAKMRAVRPELEEINRKYPNPDDAMKKQQATMELYGKVGISPMGGCLPLLIQMPILWAMFRFFPASIELRGEGFLWANDLSTYDSVLQLPFNIPFYGDHVSLFALLMTLSLFGYSYITYKQQSATTAGQPGAGMMKFMMVYFMPLMMLCFMNSYSSGLCYYYFVSQILTMLIMFIIRRSVNDEKVRAKLLAHAAKPRKKSKFQERYEEALKQQQEQMTINREQRRQRR